jgi:chromosome segregation ATPase
MPLLNDWLQLTFLLFFLLGNLVLYQTAQWRSRKLQARVVVLETELVFTKQEAERLAQELAKAEQRIARLERSVVDLAAAKARIVELERQLGRRNGEKSKARPAVMGKKKTGKQAMVDMLQEQIEIYTKQLAQLELQIAQQGGNLAPYPLLTQADELREQIRALQAELDRLQGEPDSPAQG